MGDGPQLMTAEDLWLLPDDGLRYELVRGELVNLPMSSFANSVLGVRVVAALGNFAARGKLGMVTGADCPFILARNPDTARLPNLAFVRAERLPVPEDRRRFPEMAPDLAVEVLSPSDRTVETNDKVLDYLDAGVRLVWVVDPPRRTVTVYTPDGIARVLREHDTLDGGDVLPGFQLAIADLFA